MVLPTSLLKFYPVVRSLGREAVASLDDAKRLAKTVLFLWQKSAFPHLAIRAPYGSSDLLSVERIQKFVSWLEGQPFEEAAYWLASAYAYWVGDEVRSKQALYFTPPKLADRVIDNLVGRGASLTSQHWHDPACGGAAFLVPIAQRMSCELTAQGFPPRKVLQHVEKHISGNDLDDTLLEISRQFLLMALYRYVKETNYLPEFKLEKGDGLLSSHDPLAAPDVVACNPPYRKLSAAETEKYQFLFQDVIRNQPNIYGLFIRKTIDIVKPGGLVGLLTPTSFLSGASFSKLRRVITTESQPLQIDILNDRSTTFIAVQQQTAITVLRSRKAAQRPTGTEIFVLTDACEFATVGTSVLPNNGASWPIPRTVEDADLLLRAKGWKHRISDYGYFPRIGHLVAYRDDRPRFEKRPKLKDQTCIVPIVWAGDIAVSGFEHGRQHKLDRTDFYVEVSKPDHSSVISAPAVLLQRLTSSDQAHRLIACAVPRTWQAIEGGFVAENHVLALIANQDSVWSPELIASLVNSEVVNRLYRAISGATNVAVSEINQMPLPDPEKLMTAILNKVDIEKAVRMAFGLG
jgi:adenine-specific DNA-methyltransferase